MASHRPFSLNCPIQSPGFPLPSGYVPKQVDPASVVTAFPRSPIKSKNMIIKKNLQRSRTCSFKIRRHLQSTSLFFIEARDLQVLIIASEVDGLTSAYSIFSSVNGPALLFL
jgi:hypothetical protein